MGFIPYQIVLGAVGFFFVFKIVSSIIISRRHRATAAKLGCAPPAELPKKDPIGLTRLLEAAGANGKGRGPVWFMDILNEMGKDVHTLHAQVLDYEVLVTRDLENVKAMFNSQSSNFEIGTYRSEIWRPLLGDGIFTSEGEAWKHSRGLVRPQFSRDAVSDLELEERHVQVLFQQDALRPREDGWTKAFDLGPYFYNLTLDVSTEFLYGQSVHSQGCTTPTNYSSEKGTSLDDIEALNRAEFGYHLDAGKGWIYTKGLFGRWNSLIRSPQFTRHCNAVHQFVDGFVAARLAQPESKSTTPDEKLKKFFLLDELAKQTQDPLELRNETLQVLNAGRDTTGSLLGWVFYFLARSPATFEKLRSTIIYEFGEVSNSNITFQALRSCHYLQHVVNECLRLGAIIPLNERVCLCDTTLPRGGGKDGQQPIYLPKGTRVLISNYAMQHREDIWGEDAMEFKPERWEGRRAGWEFTPFGGGPRKCIGQQFALIEASYVIIRMLQRFDAVEHTDAAGPIMFHHMVTNRSGAGVNVRLRHAAVKSASTESAAIPATTATTTSSFSSSTSTNNNTTTTSSTTTIS